MVTYSFPREIKCKCGGRYRLWQIDNDVLSNPDEIFTCSQCGHLTKHPWEENTLWKDNKGVVE